MAIQLSVAARNARLNAITSTVGSTAVLKMFTGTQPATCATADSGTLLLTMTLPATWQAAASAGASSLAGTWTGSASAAGTAGYYRIYDSTGTTCHEQGTVGTSGTDLILSPSAALTVSQPVTITSHTLTDANA
jgi:hypothetical protein